MIRALIVLVLVGLAPTQAQNRSAKDVFEHIRSLAKLNDPGLEKYLKSLSPDEMLDATRYCCAEGESYPERSDSEFGYVGEVCAFTCLEYYFDKQALGVAANKLINIVCDTDESASFRRALIVAMGSSNSCQGKFKAYVDAHSGDVARILAKTLAEPAQEPMLRSTTLNTLVTLDRNEMSLIYSSDPNVIEIRRHSDKVVRIGELGSV